MCHHSRRHQLPILQCRSRPLPRLVPPLASSKYVLGFVRSDDQIVPLGTLLSGGFESSSNALAIRSLSKTPHAISLSNFESSLMAILIRSLLRIPQAIRYTILLSSIFLITFGPLFVQIQFPNEVPLRADLELELRKTLTSPFWMQWEL